MKKRKTNRVANFGRIVWLYIKYQLLTKLLVAMIVFPVMSMLVQGLLHSTGRTNLSSGDYLTFLTSPQGVVLSGVTLLLVILLMGLDINAFVIAGGLVYTRRIKLSARQLLRVAIQSLSDFLNPSGVLMLLYIALVGPLIGSGITIEPFRDFRIPNFIMDVVYNNGLYMTLYMVVILVLTSITLKYAFFLHYVLLLKCSPRQAIRESSQLMKRHWKAFVRDFIIKGLLVFIGIVVCITVLGVAYIFGITTVLEVEILQSFAVIYGVLTLYEGIWFVSLMLVPIICYRLTVLFYRYYEQDYGDTPFRVSIQADELGDQAYQKVKFKTKVSLLFSSMLLLLWNTIIAISWAYSTEDDWLPNKSIAIVAHRGGGDLAAENTLASLEAAIQEGALWSEIDVQRTKDGHYIIHHDTTFQRLSNDHRTSFDMTLSDIQQLSVQDLFDTTRPSQPVATLEQMLDTAKGRIGLYIELKGKTADTRMVDDVVTMIKAHQMEKEVALLSLDYALIQYIEATYPELMSGFLYFFAVGDVTQLVGDILIMEEREATDEKVADIHQAGKKAVVWTVNTEESIATFVNSDVDGIITDNVKAVKEGMKHRHMQWDISNILTELWDNF